MNNFLGFIQKDVISFCDNLLNHLYKFNKSESNNVKARCHKINYLVKQIKDANFSLYNELKLLQQEVEFETENLRKKENELLKRTLKNR